MQQGLWERMVGGSNWDGANRRMMGRWTTGKGDNKEGPSGEDGSLAGQDQVIPKALNVMVQIVSKPFP